jgi:hypothetical protein
MASPQFQCEPSLMHQTTLIGHRCLEICTLLVHATLFSFAAILHTCVSYWLIVDGGFNTAFKPKSVLLVTTRHTAIQFKKLNVVLYIYQWCIVF